MVEFRHDCNRPRNVDSSGEGEWLTQGAMALAAVGPLRPRAVKPATAISETRANVTMSFGAVRIRRICSPTAGALGCERP
jgi:hypothetical protein